MYLICTIFVKPYDKDFTDNDINDTVFIVVTGHTDTEGNPMNAAIKPNGIGNYFGIEVPSNFLLSGYGKNSFHGFVARSKAENRILYANKSSRSLG